MKRTVKRTCSILLSTVLLCIIILAGCSNTGQNSESAPVIEDGKLDTSKKVELQFYMLGDAPKDLAEIEAEINKMALEDLNATVKFNFTTWTDWDQKYKLLLSSGQSIDLIFTAEWTQYQSYAKAGAFLALDDLLPVAAPELHKFVPEDMWSAVKIDDNIYTIPATYKEYVNNGFVYREDLRKKYDLPKPVDLETFEAYMDGIKQNEPDMMPVSLNSDVIGNLHDRYTEINSFAGPTKYGVGVKYDNPKEPYIFWGSEEHTAELEMLKRWADKGFIPKNVLNIKDTLQSQITSGKAAAIFGDNPTRFNDAVIKIKASHPDWELAYTPFAEKTGYSTPVHPIHNGFAVPKNSKNAERALAFYEKLVTDERYNLLTQYGTEGKNYEVDTNGYYKLIGDAQSNGFPREGMNGWAWRNPEFMLFDEGYDGVKAIFEELDKVQKPDIFTGFAEDYTSYQAEKAALEQVEKQYLYPLLAGLVDNIEEGMNTFLAKAKQAGLEKVQTEYTKQWNTYVEEQGIQ